MFSGVREAMANPGLDDSHYAALAWGRFRKLMIWMVAASSATTIGGLLFLKSMIGMIPVHMAIATGLGIFASVMLAAALMGLVFLSAGTGHDETIVDPFEDLNP
jgi:hypothetical protein